MAELSRSRLLTCVAKVESAWGTDSTPAGGTDDVTVIESENPWSPNIERVAIRPHTASFTKQVKSAIGSQLAGVSLQGLLQGPSTRGTPDNGTAGMIALFNACGLHETNTTGVSGTVSFAPATVAQATSATVKMAGENILWSAPGFFGTSLTLSGDTSNNIKPRWAVQGIAKYVEPAITSGGIASVTAPDRAVSALGGTASITPSGGNAYSCATTPALELLSWSVNFSATVGQVRSVCASTGISQLIHADRTGTMSLTMALESDDSATLDYEDIHGDLIGQTTHLVTLTWGTDPYKWKINVPTAELASISPPTTINGFRAVTITYDLFHATANSEITIAVGNPA